MNTKKTRIAIIGLGYWGKNLLRNLVELGVVHTACDRQDAIIAERKKSFPAVHYTTSFDEILENPDINAIVIAVPAVKHFDYCLRALRAGKDVFVEKPLALEVTQGEELLKVAREKKRILMVGHILQYHPALIKLKQLISDGELGKIRYIYSNRLNIGKLRTEENILWSFAPHDISAILMLLGEEPVSVSAFGGDYLTKGINDVTLTHLEFANGVRAHVFVSWLHPFKEQKLIVVGSKGMAVFDDVAKEKLFVYPHRIEWKDGKIPFAQKADFKTIKVPDGEPLKLELSHFIDCIRSRTTPKTDAQEGLRVLKVLDAAEKSLAKKMIPHEKGNPKSYFVHESSYVDTGVKIESGTKIWHFSHILHNCRIGKNCTIGQNVVIGPDVVVGDSCKIQNNVSLYKGVTLKNDVFCGPSCVFTNVYNPRAFIERKHEFRPTLVERGATIGANATIVCGVKIGEYALVGAGAVIKKDVAPYAVVVGVPAKQIGWVCVCGNTISVVRRKHICLSCGNTYTVKKHTLIKK
ncbi:MAG TPA: Gfo/Idh/MocA family oxidoreductase [Candidatus Omnitrophota bacterium]|nr:Gfo/Idh/MocA family oxidoreductase [Candidatus Omnitrophota bacterium]